jgi:hypothetical protein
MSDDATRLAEVVRQYGFDEAADLIEGKAGNEAAPAEQPPTLVPDPQPDPDTTERFLAQIQAARNKNTVSLPGLLEL